METLVQNKKDLIITRIFDTPRELVWKAWTEPERVKKWWGPKDYTCPVADIDFKIGGKYLNSMRGPDGKDIWSTGVYKEIVPMSKIVCTDSFADEKGNIVPSTHYGMEGFPLELEITITLEKVSKNKTRMTLRHVGIPEGTMKDLTNIGWNESFDKLAKSLR